MSSEGQNSGGGLPGAPQPTPGFPLNVMPIVFEGFDGLNTKPLRPAIEDQQMYWCDGFFPIGKSNLRTLFGLGSALYTVTPPNSILWVGFGNFHDAAYMYVLLSNGSVQQVAVSDGSVTQVMAPGTITSPAPQSFGFTQWESRYAIFTANQDNGYWIWDGTSLFSAGGVGPIVTLTNAGLNYTSAPTITLTTTGSGTGATFSGTVQNGSVVNISVTNPGSGFGINDFAILTISGGGSDTTAQAFATINTSSGGLSGAFVTTPGHGYGVTDAVTLSGGSPTTAGSIITSVGDGGEILSLQVVNPGVGYTSAPTMSISTGSGFAGFTTISTGQIASISVTDGGTGYKTPPTVTIIGDGQGAQAQAQISAAGAVTGVTVLNGGFGYTKALVQFTGGNNAADATITLMPFGISGTTAETYQNHVWVGSISQNIPKVIFSAPNDVANFSPADGGGAFPLTDAFLRVAPHRLIQSNGFLYIIGDSSINYVSGVQTSASGATTFNNLNVDPQIGSPWPWSVQVFSRNIIVPNSFGTHVSYGGAVTKISQPLDGIYNTVLTENTTGGTGGTPGNFFPSGAVASIFGIQVYMLLLPIVDPYTGQPVNKLLMWDGKKWFTSDQEVQLTFIATQEINSILTAWGTDGTSVYPLFQNPSTLFQKVVQSKLWARPSYLFRKDVPFVAGIANFFTTAGTITITIDNELGGHSSVAAVDANGAIWTNGLGAIVSWVNASNQPVIWPVPGLALIGPQYATQNGVLMGMTITTEAADLALVSMMLVEQNYSSRL